MKKLNITFIVVVIVLFGCTHKDKKTNLTTTENTADKQIIQTEKQNNLAKLEEYKIDSINTVIALFKQKNIDEIARKISFPLKREYPIPPIKNNTEFKERFNEVFDQILIDRIAKSKIDQWTEMGWRGIMLDNGVIWMANSDGIITSVNYQSAFEKKLRDNLIDIDKKNLHVSLKDFESPFYKIKTKNYLIRIDLLNNNEYRYASWKIDKKESSKPDIILLNGEIEYQGSGGNHVITFLNDNYTYKIFRHIMGTIDSPDVSLIIIKDNKEILNQEGALEE